MYFVVIDLKQLCTRLQHTSGRHAVDLDLWLDRHGFVQTPEGWFGSADGMNSLSCSEILFSEWRHPFHRSTPSRHAVSV